MTLDETSTTFECLHIFNEILNNLPNPSFCSTVFSPAAVWDRRTSCSSVDTACTGFCLAPVGLPLATWHWELGTWALGPGLGRELGRDGALCLCMSHEQ